jgi:hypothetical protein
MKKQITLVMLVTLFFVSPVSASTITAKDVAVYAYKNGELLGEGVRSSTVYEVDSQGGTIKEVSTAVNQDGPDAGSSGQPDPDPYKIIAEQDGHIVAAKWSVNSTDVVEFYRNGTFTSFSSKHNLKVPISGNPIVGNYTIVIFGTYDMES